MEVGDLVLLANKGERGKRKLADRWENAVYIVVDKNDGSHTFRIRHSVSGQVKLVHRNLIMPVNFLPLPEAASPVQGDVSDSVVGHDDMEASAAVSGDSVEYRTRVWVSTMPSRTSSASSLEDSGQDVDVGFGQQFDVESASSAGAL